MIGAALAIAICSASVQGAPAAGGSQSVTVPDAPLLVLPRESLTWSTDGFGQVIGVTIGSKPMPARIRSIEPTTPLPAPLKAEQGSSSLRIIGKTEKGRERDIAILLWDGEVISWQRLSVPTAAFASSLAGLAEWMATDSFTVTLEDGSRVRIATESQHVSVEVGTPSGSSGVVGIAGIRAGARLAVPDAADRSGDGKPDAGLVRIGCDDLSCRISTSPDTVIDIEVTRTPPQVRVTSQTPSSLLLERAVRDLEATDEILKTAPADQQAILSPQRAAQQRRVDELRKAAASETIRPTDSPVRACLVDPGTGREYVTIMISIVASPRASTGSAPAGAAGDRGSRARSGRGAP